LSGKEWELRQCGVELKALSAAAAGIDRRTIERRTYAVVVAASNTLEIEFNRQLNILMREPDMWEHLIPFSAHTRTFRCLLFRLGSRSMCLVESRLVCRHQRDPIAIFTVLGSDVDALRVAAEKLCLRCPAWRSFVVKYRVEPGGLSGADAQAILRSHARAMRTHIVRIEAMHSVFRRRVTVRGVQTHAESLEEANAEMTLDRVRNQSFVRVHARGLQAATHAEAKVVGSASVAEGGATSHCGGPWRLFIRRKTIGTAGKPDFGTLALDYKDLNAVEKANLVQQGDSGRVARSAGAPTTFGPSSKQMMKQRADGLASDALAVAGYSVAAAAMPTGLVVEAAVDRAALAPNSSMSQMYRQANLEVRAVRQQKRREADAAARALQSWTAKATSEARRVLKDAWPGSEKVSRHLILLPDLDDTVLRYELDPSFVGDIAERIQTNKASNMMDMLLADWRVKNRRIEHSRSAPIVADDVPTTSKGKPACHEVGLCLCDDDGDAVYRMRSSFVRIMRAQLKVGTRERDLLREGFVVAVVRGVRQGPKNEFEHALCELSGAPVDPLNETGYWHCGFTHLSPFTPTFLPMDVAPEDGIDGNTTCVQASKGIDECV
jgi:hypothetical protein